jgi:glucokinase
VLDPELIVIGGGLVELGPLLFDPLHAAFMRHVEGAAFRPEIPIVPARLGERAGAVGAAVLARELLA